MPNCRIIWWCLLRVPVQHWGRLFHYLRRLHATFEAAHAEGRGWVNWCLRSDGTIWVRDWEETAHERSRRMPDDLTRAPWTRLAPGGWRGVLDLGRTGFRLFSDGFQTVTGLSLDGAALSLLASLRAHLPQFTPPCLHPP